MCRDMPLKTSIDETLKQFDLLVKYCEGRGAGERILACKAFLEECFEEAGKESVQYTLDIQDSLTYLHENMSTRWPSHYCIWAKDLAISWNSLCKRADEHNPKCSLLPAPYPFMIPGARFRESYYWDSYWIIKGLLACNLTDLAKVHVCDALFVLFLFLFCSVHALKEFH